MPITLFPFNGGLNSHIDRRLLPDGALADAVNVELDRQGRLVGRAKYTAQAMTVQGGTAISAGTLVAYDLFTLNERLFALGDAFNFGFATDIYEIMPSGTAKRWHPTSLDAAAGATPRLPRATRLRDMARPPDPSDSISNMDGAAGGGFAALVWNLVGIGASVSVDGYVHIVSAATGESVLYEFFQALGDGPVAKVRVIALSDRFLFIGLDFGTSGIGLSRWIYATDERVTFVASHITGFIGTTDAFNVCKVAGSDQFVVVSNVIGTVHVQRFSNAGVLQVPSGGAYADIVAAATYLAVEASSTANQITVAMLVGGEARLFSYNLATGAAIGVGPFVPFTGETSIDVALVRVSSTVLEVLSSVTSETAPTIFSRRYTVSTNAFGTLLRAVTDGQLAAAPAFQAEVFFGMRVGLGTVGNTPNMLVSHGDDDDEVTPLAAKDFEVAGTMTVNLLPSISQDASTGKWYWPTAAANPDGDLAPMLTEFDMGSTARRQTAVSGNHAYIAGACPLVFDGISGVESGFLERPRIISLTPSNGAGELLGGGTYRYRCHWEWIDSEGDLHLSPPSAITSVDLASAHDTVTAVVTTPHSLRWNQGTIDGVVRCVISRTLATVSETAPELLGDNVVEPPSSSLNGLTLLVFITDSAGAQLFTVTFDAGSTGIAAIVTKINGVTSARVTASNVGGAVLLTANESGEGVSLWIYGGTGASILGFVANEHDDGTTTYTVGENFQRAAVAYTALGGAAVAAYVTITDLRKDQSDPIVDSDLIRQQVLYSQGTASGAHHAPPPSECLWAGRERLIASKQPKRSRYTASKLIVPAEPAEFSAEGFLAFSGTVAGDIEASAMLGDTMVHWTRRQIWFVTGSGPDRSGQGTFFAAQLISKTMGLASPDGWRSLCEDDAGIWFQGSDKEIYRLSKGGAVEWLGKEVQDKLLLFPIVTAALYVPSKQEVAFAITSTDGLTGGILRYREERQAWFFDDVGVVTSMADYQGRIAIVQAGVVLIQDAAPGVGAAVPYNAVTGMFQGFQALGYGALQQVGVLGTYRGPFTLEILKSIDGTTFPTSLGSWVVTGADYAVGDRVTKLVTPAVMQHDQFALKYVVTPTADSEGLWLHAAAVETDKQPGFVRAGAAHNL